jgi:chromosome segregation ATPase
MSADWENRNMGVGNGGGDVGGAREQEFQRQIELLQKEKHFLVDLNRRSQDELRRMQAKHGAGDRAAAAASDDPEDELDQLPPWATSVDYMPPLIAAYDARLQDLDMVCDNLKGEMGTLTEHADELKDENQKLFNDLQKSMDALVEKAEIGPLGAATVGLGLGGGGGGGGKAHGGQSAGGIKTDEEISELHERIDILMAENNVLIEQATLGQTDCERLQNELRLRDQQLARTAEGLRQATQAVQQMEQSQATLQEHCQHCEQKLQEMSAQCASEQDRSELSRQAAEQLTESLKQKAAHVANLENAIAEMRHRNDSEIDALSEQTQTHVSRSRELQVEAEPSLAPRPTRPTRPMSHRCLPRDRCSR